MLFAPHLAGPHEPVLAEPTQRPGSVRRTTTIDSLRPEGVTGPILADARGRDARIGPSGELDVVAAQRFWATLDGVTRTIVELDAEPPATGLEKLEGALVGPGFRARTAELPGGTVTPGTLMHTLLDDWAGASLVSGYAGQRAAADVGSPTVRLSPSVLDGLTDICAGWAGDASMVTLVRRDGSVPTPLGPPAPALGFDDPVLWHQVAPLAAYGMRRLRRLDVWGVDADRIGFSAHFRDSHVDAVGDETVVHEYTAEGTADRTDRTVTAVEAMARVLPWQECPRALGSVQDIVGLRLDELRPRIRAEFVGTSTCTHLNDTLRSIGDVDHLLAYV